MRSTSRTNVYLFVLVVLSMTLSAACGLGSRIGGGGGGGGDKTGKGWRVWIRTEPCSGRFDWLSVAKEQGGAGTGSGKNSYVPYETVLGNQGCTAADNSGCTFAEANALMEKLRGDRKFLEYCCRDYSVWENAESKERSVVTGKFSTKGYGWTLVKGDLCCEEAEELAGIPGACGGNGVGNKGHGTCRGGAYSLGTPTPDTWRLGTPGVGVVIPWSTPFGVNIAAHSIQVFRAGTSERIGDYNHLPDSQETRTNACGNSYSFYMPFAGAFDAYLYDNDQSTSPVAGPVRFTVTQ